MRTSLRTEGMILHALDFQDYDRIITVFTPDQGIIKLFIKGARSARYKKGESTSPLTVAEYVYRKGKSDLMPCQEISVLNPHRELRKNLPALETACDLLQTIQKSQFPEKPAPTLYQLLTRYIEAIPQFSSPEILAASFRLKLLRYEGLLSQLTQCSICGAPSSSLYLVQGESFCQTHTAEGHHYFSEEEAKLLICLAYCRTLSALQPIFLPPEFQDRVKELFEEVILLA